MPHVEILSFTKFIFTKYLNYIQKIQNFLLHSPEFKKIFDEKIEFVQADLTRDAHVTKAFKSDDGPWTYVFNLASETRLGLEPAIYKQKCKDLALKVGQACVDMGVQHYVEVCICTFFYFTAAE